MRLTVNICSREYPDFEFDSVEFEVRNVAFSKKSFHFMLPDRETIVGINYEDYPEIMNVCAW